MKIYFACDEKIEIIDTERTASCDITGFEKVLEGLGLTESKALRASKAMEESKALMATSIKLFSLRRRENARRPLLFSYDLFTK